MSAYGHESRLLNHRVRQPRTAAGLIPSTSEASGGVCFVSDGLATNESLTHLNVTSNETEPVTAHS